MTIYLLGPVRFTMANGVVRAGPAKQSCLLAALALAARRLVTVEELVGCLWGYGPPRAARSVVYSHIARLRQALPDGSGVRIVSVGGGYQLEAGPEQVDVLRSRVLASRARAAAQTGSHDVAVELWREAQQLWRGPALAGVDGDWAATVRANLEREYLGVLDGRFGTELALGRPAEVLDELLDLTSRYPLVEALLGHLMLALHRSGRSAEALAVFADARNRIGDDLGAAPGPHLVALHQSILRDEPIGAKPKPRHSGGVPRPVPRHLPADTVHFRGREGVLATLLAPTTVDGPSPGTPMITVITAAGGMGKTAVAVRYAHLIAHRFGDGQFFADLRGSSAGASLPPAAVLQRFLRALGVEAGAVPADLDEQVELFRSLTADKSVLVVLDNVDSADQVRPLLPASATAAVIVTSRDRLGSLSTRDGARHVTLTALDVAESVAILRTIIGDARADGETDAVARLARLCAGTPLALQIVGTQLANGPGRPIAELATRLAAGGRLELLRDGDDPGTAVAAAFETSYQRLSPAERRLFRLLAIAEAQDIGEQAVAALAGVALSTARQSLDRLTGAHLVEHKAAGRYGLHDLLQEYGAQQPHDDPDDPATALRRLLDWYLSLVLAAVSMACPSLCRLPESRLPPGVAPGTFDDASDAAAWLDDERGNLVAAVRLAAASGCPEHACFLSDALRAYFYSRWHIVDWRETAELALRAARPPADDWLLASAHLNVATLLSCTNRPAQSVASYEAALTHARAVDWDENIASSLGGLGNMYVQLGQPARAMRVQTDAVRLSMRSDRPARLVTCLCQLGFTYGHLGRLAESAHTYARAARLADDVGSAGLRVLAEVNLGCSYELLDDLDAAGEHLSRGLSLSRQAGDRNGEATALLGLAAVHRDLGRPEQAAEAAAEALAIASASGNAIVEAFVRSDFPRDPGDRDLALQQAREARAHYAEAWVLVEVSRQRLQREELVDAELTARAALDIARTSSYRLLEGRALNALAALHLRLGKHRAARGFAEAAATVHRETRHRRGQRESDDIRELCVAAARS